MREWTVGPEAEGKRLDRYLAARLGGVPAGALQKYLRLGRVKRNTRRASASDRLCAGDTLQLYLSDIIIRRFQRTEISERLHWTRL